MNARPLRKININNLPILSGEFKATADWMASRAGMRDATTMVAHVNVHNYYLANQGDTDIAKITRDYHLLFDGIGMKLGAMLLGNGWVDDLNGTDLAPLVFSRLAEAKLGVYFLGGTDAVASRAAQRCKTDALGLEICGWHSGYFSRREEHDLVNQIRDSGAQVLLVALGSGMQEDFLLRNRLKFGVSLIWNAGGLLDFLSAAKPRAPLWLRRARLEWAFRLWMEPTRMAHRNLIEGPWFLFHILLLRFSSGRTRSEPASTR